MEEKKNMKIQQEEKKIKMMVAWQVTRHLLDSDL